MTPKKKFVDKPEWQIRRKVRKRTNKKLCRVAFNIEAETFDMFSKVCKLMGDVQVLTIETLMKHYVVANKEEYEARMNKFFDPDYEENKVENITEAKNNKPVKPIKTVKPVKIDKLNVEPIKPVEKVKPVKTEKLNVEPIKPVKPVKPSGKYIKPENPYRTPIRPGEKIAGSKGNKLT